VSDPLDELFGASPPVEALRQELRRLLSRWHSARRLPAILIRGETGTGKGLVARMLHRAGPRASAPFVDVNCAAIPEGMFEAELFGYERGAFTDARRAKPGLLQTAHRGVIFLDELALLPPALQPKLLKAIEEQAVRRLGATQSESIDVWIVAATNTDLDAAIRDRRFREDLYHRLAVVTLHLPPLRERGQDIVLLANRFLARFCADFALPVKRLAPDAERRLTSYPWPGNVRELSNTIERTALLADGDIISADMLEFESRGFPVATAAGRRPHRTVGEPAPLAEETSPAESASLEDVKRGKLLETLEGTSWNISRTAALLALSRNTVRARIARYGLRPVAPTTGPAGLVEEFQTVPPDAAEATAGLLVEEPQPSGVDDRAARTPLIARELPIRWERRPLTLLSVRLALADRDSLLDVGRALEAVVDKIRAFGGRVEEIFQGGLDASFGLEPIDDAPRRAANAAIAIARAARTGGGLEPTLPPVRIGLHAGSFLVARIAGRAQIDHEAKAQAFAILDALLSGAEVGAVVASEASVSLLERRFALTPLDPDGGQARRVLGPGGTGLGLWGTLERFVGRREELDLLHERRALAASGRGQIVGIAGDPGIGKSRLLWEFLHSDALVSWRILETSAMALGSPSPYLPVTELLRACFGIEPGEAQGAALAKLKDKLGASAERLALALVPLQALLDLPVQDAAWSALEPLRRRQLTLQAVKSVFLEESRHQPLLLALDNAHWIDSETQAVLERLAEAIPRSPVLLVLTYRPEYRHDLLSRTYFTQIRLDPLSGQPADELLDNLLGRHESLTSVRPRLLQWTDGNPFFIEESVRSLVETGVLAGEPGNYRLTGPLATIQAPAAVEQVLAERVHRLADEDRWLLQLAAVIGRELELPVLAEIADLPRAAGGAHPPSAGRVPVRDGGAARARVHLQARADP
jgi:DNA-binding NtrC family response regulator